MESINVSKELAGSWTVDGDTVRVNIPFSKVNDEKRTVSGFATLDNVDQHGDIVDYEASVKAFSSFRGNIREMHMPVAVGKMVDFQPRDFTDPDTGESYKGIFVTAYVSKGAQDTWEKVKDGTLSGFSIGGNIKKKEVKKVGDSYVSVIKEYLLGELSLVDSPANQFANLFSFSKAGDTNVVSGMAADLKVLNILIGEDDTVIITKDEARDGYENIGWVEEVGDYSEEVAKAIVDYKIRKVEKPSSENAGASENSSLEKDLEGGATVAEEIKDEAVEETVEKSNDEVQTDEAVTDEVVEEVEEVEKAANVDETEALSTPDVDVDAIIAKVLESVKAEIAKNATEVAAQAPADDEESDVAKALSALTDTISKLTDKVGEVDSRVSDMENSKGVKKSLDVVEDDEIEGEEGESFWRGGFLGTGNLVK